MLWSKWRPLKDDPQVTRPIIQGGKRYRLSTISNELIIDLQNPYVSSMLNSYKITATLRHIAAISNKRKKLTNLWTGITIGTITSSCPVLRKNVYERRPMLCVAQLRYNQKKNNGIFSSRNTKWRIFFLFVSTIALHLIPKRIDECPNYNIPQQEMKMPIQENKKTFN